jgi:hypothetical protein
MAKYDWEETKNLEEAASVEDAVRTTIINYFRQQLGEADGSANSA